MRLGSWSSILKNCQHVFVPGTARRNTVRGMVSSSDTTEAMLKAPDHQVAGHEARDGKLGPLVDDTGRFYKPLQDDERGLRELAFYKKFSTMAEIPSHIRRFFPTFHGSQTVESSDGSGLRPHIVLNDVVFGRTNPSVMDIKMGSRTWYPQASEEYIFKTLKKDRESTSVSLGFRISGLKVYVSDESGFWKPDKKVVRSYTSDDVGLILRKFVSCNLETPNSNADADCSLASVVYGGTGGILSQLLELKEWFEVQTDFHFNSCSVLMVYQKESGMKGSTSGVDVKLVDFAHVVEGNGVIDHNFLGGLCSLIKFISDIVSNARGAAPLLDN